jgi:hypothetical protein
MTISWSALQIQAASLSLLLTLGVTTLLPVSVALADEISELEDDIHNKRCARFDARKLKYDARIFIKNVKHRNMYTIITLKGAPTNEAVTVNYCINDKCDDYLYCDLMKHNTYKYQRETHYKLDVMYAGSKKLASFDIDSKYTLIHKRNQQTRFSLKYRDGINKSDNLFSKMYNPTEYVKPLLSNSGIKEDIRYLSNSGFIKFEYVTAKHNVTNKVKVNTFKTVYKKMNTEDRIRLIEGVGYHENGSQFWCNTSKEAVILDNLDKCKFDLNGQKVIKFYPHKGLCDTGKIKINNFTNYLNRKQERLEDYCSNELSRLKPPKYCSLSNSKPLPRTEKLKTSGISLTSVNIKYRDKLFSRHKSTFVIVDIRGNLKDSSKTKLKKELNDLFSTAKEKLRAHDIKYFFTGRGQFYRYADLNEAIEYPSRNKVEDYFRQRSDSINRADELDDVLKQIIGYRDRHLVYITNSVSTTDLKKIKRSLRDNPDITITFLNVGGYYNVKKFKSLKRFNIFQLPLKKYKTYQIADYAKKIIEGVHPTKKSGKCSL